MKSILISVGAIVSPLAWAASPLPEPADTAVAQADKPPMEHIVVSVAAHKKEAQTALPVSILDAEALQRQAAATLGDTLNNLPGLSSASFGPGVGQPVVRGHQGPRVQVLRNGLPSLDVSSNSADHAVSVEPLFADSIEVLRGPATLLYGSGAIGGVVNVIDRTIPSRHSTGLDAAVELRHSSVDDGRSGVLRLDSGAGNWTFNAQGLFRDWGEPDIPGYALNSAVVDDPQELAESSDGHLENASGRSRQQSLGVAYHFSSDAIESGYIGLSYSNLDSEYGIPAGVHAHHDEDEEEEADEHHEGGIRLDIRQQRWDVAGDFHLDGFWELLRWRAAYSEYQHGEVEPSGEVGTRFSRDAHALRVELSHSPLGRWHGAVGLQYLDSDFQAVGEEAFVPPSRNRALGVFVLEDFHGEGWQIEAGLRLDRDELTTDNQAKDADYSGISGSLAGLLDISEHWLLSLSWAQSRRAATAEERYSNVLNDPDQWLVHGASGAIELGDEHLGREKSDNVELRFRGDYRRFNAELSLYSNQFNDFIYLQNTGAEVDGAAVLQYRQQDAEFRGLEYELSVQLLPLMASASVELGLFGDYVRAELDSGDDIPRLPPQRHGIRLAWQQAIAGGEAFAQGSWLYAAAQDAPGENESASDGYHRLDTTLGWRIEHTGNRYSAMLRGRNLGDEEIRNSASFIRDRAAEPGRSLELVLRVEFGG